MRRGRNRQASKRSERDPPSPPWVPLSRQSRQHTLSECEQQQEEDQLACEYNAGGSAGCRQIVRSGAVGVLNKQRHHARYARRSVVMAVADD